MTPDADAWAWPLGTGNVYARELAVVAWMLWKQRNERTFNNQSRSVQSLVQGIAEECRVWDLAGFRRFALVASSVAKYSIFIVS